MKFFRKIRQRLLSENKLSKYLIYAMGEIVLVVIGILIALAINNNNQQRVLRKKEQTYLIGLKNEFQTSKFKLMELIEVNRKTYQSAREILEYMSDDNPPLTEKRFSELLYGAFSLDISFIPNKSLLSEMINSGSLKDISNTGLRIALTNWVSNIEDVSRQEIELGIQRGKVLDILRTDEYSLRTILDLAGVNQDLGLPQPNGNISNLELLSSTAFENNILIFILTSYATEKSHYNPLLQDLNSIIELIDSEIK